MAEKIYKNNLNIKIPTVVIKRRNYENIGSVKAYGLTYTKHFNSPNELSFTVHASDTDSHIWEEVNDYNIVCLPEYGEYFDMQAEKTEDLEVVKKVTCRSLCESELSQVNLYDIEINTEADIARDDYDPNFPTVFYRSPSDTAAYQAIWDSDKKYTVMNENGGEDRAATLEMRRRILKSSSLLHRILDKASHYSVGHIDNSLKQLSSWHEFSISNTTVYDTLMGEVAELYKCLFIFRAADRTVNAYDLCNTCKCGYRGEFTGVCPECGQADVSGAYGKDTSIYISKDNLARSASIKSNKDSLKNCFHVKGGDDVITDALASLSPGGSSYIYYFSPEAKNSMPQGLVAVIDRYNDSYGYSYDRKPFAVPDVAGYNAIVNSISQNFPDKDEFGNDRDRFHPIETTLASGQHYAQGYKNIIRYLNEATDIAYFLQSSMFPTIATEQETLEDTLARLTAENLSPISVPYAQTSVLTSIDRAVENYCRIYVNTALYRISTENTSLSEQDGQTTWHGTIRLTELADKSHSGQAEISLAVNSDLENFLKQKLEKELAKADRYAKPITDMGLDETEFATKLKLYNMDYLSGIEASFQNCLAIIVKACSETSGGKELYDTFYEPYNKRIKCIADEIASKAGQLETVKKISESLRAIKEAERKELDFRTFLGDELWAAFCSYRREDSYQNDSYISSGLTDSQILDKAQELLDAAKKELFKAGNMQYEVSAEINNLLALPEFGDFAKDFQVGNWIHMMVDETVYHLRLISCQFTFEDQISISVEFSTLAKTADGISDFESVIRTASSLSSSYSSFKQQMSHAVSASAYVSDWIKNGLDATKTKLANDSLTQEIVMDANGILCRAYDDIADGYDRHQLKLNRNALFLTDDGWQTIHSAIGRYYYYDPETEKEMAGYGVIADNIVGRFILGENLGIYNKNNSLTFDMDGLCVRSSKNAVTINPNASRLLRISKCSAVPSQDDDILYCDEHGNLHMTGTVHATDGSFTGTVHATDGSFHGTVEATDGSFTGTVHATDGSFHGTIEATDGFFRGTVDAVDGTFRGEILSENGQIGGFTITDSAFYNGISGLKEKDRGGIYLGTDGFRFNGTSKGCYVMIEDGELFSYGTYGVSTFSDGGITCFNTSNDKKGSTSVGFFVEERYSHNSISMTVDGLDILNNDTIVFRIDMNGKVYGDKFANSDDKNLLRFKDNNLSVGDSSYGALILKGGSVTLGSASGATVTSDERLKNSFRPLDEFDEVFLALTPCAFRFNNGSSGRMHFGFGAGQVKEAFLSHGFTTKDFGGFVQMKSSPDNEEFNGCEDPMGLIYTEFTSWNTHMIQKLYLENETLRQRIADLEQRMA